MILAHFNTPKFSAVFANIKILKVCSTGLLFFLSSIARHDFSDRLCRRFVAAQPMRSLTFILFGGHHYNIEKLPLTSI